jgi:hypothetical protein
MKMNKNFNTFTDFESFELKVPTFCFVTGCVSARRDRRYSSSFGIVYIIHNTKLVGHSFSTQPIAV